MDNKKTLKLRGTMEYKIKEGQDLGIGAQHLLSTEEKNDSNKKRRLRKIETVGELLHWSYANLGSVEVAQERGITKRDKLCWMIRAKLFKGLRNGTMNIGSLFADVFKMPNIVCIYCGVTPQTHLLQFAFKNSTMARVLMGSKILWHHEMPLSRPNLQN